MVSSAVNHLRSSCQLKQPSRSPHDRNHATTSSNHPPYPAHHTQPIEPILFPKLRIRLAEFPYATLFYAPETAHLGDLMRIRYGQSNLRLITQPSVFLGQWKEIAIRFENRSVLWLLYAWISAQRILSRANRTRNKEGNSPLRFPTV